MPNMNPVDAFFTWQTLIFGIVIYGVTRFLRGRFEAQWPKLRGKTSWNDFVLPIFPIVLGVFVAKYLKSYPFPASMTEPKLRAFLGAVIGGLSTICYRLLKAIVKKQWGVDLSVYPPALPSPVTISIPPTPNVPSIEEQKEK